MWIQLKNYLELNLTNIKKKPSHVDVKESNKIEIIRSIKQYKSIIFGWSEANFTQQETKTSRKRKSIN